MRRASESCRRVAVLVALGGLVRCSLDQRTLTVSAPDRPASGGATETASGGAPSLPAAGGRVGTGGSRDGCAENDAATGSGGVPDAPLPTACSPACFDGDGCSTSADCVSRICDQGTCASPTCDDGVQNGEETAVDCGGSCDACG